MDKKNKVILKIKIKHRQALVQEEFLPKKQRENPIKCWEADNKKEGKARCQCEVKI